MKAKKFSANKYFNKSEGLYISTDDNSIMITIKGESSNEIAETARTILPILNKPYNEAMAYLRENEENYSWGIITTEERNKRVTEINQLY